MHNAVWTVRIRNRGPHLPLVPAFDPMEDQRHSGGWQVLPIFQTVRAYRVGASDQLAVVEESIWKLEDLWVRPVVIDQLGDAACIVAVGRSFSSAAAAAAAGIEWPGNQPLEQRHAEAALVRDSRVDDRTELLWIARDDQQPVRPQQRRDRGDCLRLKRLACLVDEDGVEEITLL